MLAREARPAPPAPRGIVPFQVVSPANQRIRHEFPLNPLEALGKRPATGPDWPTAVASAITPGLDSLTAIELGIHLRRRLGVDFTPIQLLAGPTPLGMRDQVIGALEPIGALART